MAKITDVALKNLKGVKGKPHVESCGDGLGLKVTINQGGKTAKKWVLRYSDITKKRQKCTIGSYPDLTLAKARALAEDLKAKAKTGVNLAQENKRAKREKTAGIEGGKNTFELVARAWLERRTLDWAPSHAKRQRERLEGNIFTVFGDKSVNSVTMQDVDSALKFVIDRGSRDTAHRICTILKSVFEYADAMGYLSDISIITRLSSYKRALPQPKKEQHFYREMTEEQIGALLLAIEESRFRWTLPVSIALRLAPYVIVRPGELCNAEWVELDLANAEWSIPGRRMKAKRDHIVPLSHQALTLFREIHKYSGNKQYVFPTWGRKGTPITTNALVGALRKLGYRSTLQNSESSFTTHGFRGMASTTFYQRFKWPGDYTEHQLAHKEVNRVKAAYNRVNPSSYLEERREMMQEYADFLDALRDKAQS